MKMPIHSPKWRVLGDHTPQMRSSLTALPCVETRNTTYRSNCLCPAGPSTQLSKSYALQWARRHSPKSAPSRGNICTPSNTWIPGLTRLSVPNGISIGSAVFAQMTAECPYLYNGTPLTPQNCPFPWGMWTPMVPWAHSSPQPKRHLDRFSNCWRAQ